METLEHDELVKLYQALLSGNDYKAVTPLQKTVKARVLAEIAMAKKNGRQIGIPFE